MKTKKLRASLIATAIFSSAVLSAQTARLQVIHNAADPAAASVDVYINGNLTLDNFAFRTATPYIDVPAGVQLSIGVAPGNSTSVIDTLKNFNVTLANGNKYVAIANGVLNPASFASNPDAVSTAFTLFLQDQMRETATTSTNIDFRAVHGASDAPTVDVIARGVATLVDNAPYAAITNYISVPAADYILDVTPGSDNSVIVASYNAPFSGLAGQSAVVLASGFLAPAANQNGQAFTLIAVLADGTVVTLSNAVGINEINKNDNVVVYPNPANDNINIDVKNYNQIIITDISGKVVMNLDSTSTQNNTIDISNLSNGIYFVTIKSDEQLITKKLIKN